HLCDDAAGNTMMIASCDQRCSGWRTERGGMKHVVAQTAVGQPLKSWRLDRSAKNRRRAEANVISQDEQDVQRTLRCFNPLGKVRRGLLGRSSNLAREWLFGFWQALLRPCRQRNSRPQREGEGYHSVSSFHALLLFVCSSALMIRKNVLLDHKTLVSQR